MSTCCCTAANSSSTWTPPRRCRQGPLAPRHGMASHLMLHQWHLHRPACAWTQCVMEALRLLGGQEAAAGALSRCVRGGGGAGRGVGATPGAGSCAGRREGLWCGSAALCGLPRTLPLQPACPMQGICKSRGGAGGAGLGRPAGRGQPACRAGGCRAPLGRVGAQAATRQQGRARVGGRQPRGAGRRRQHLGALNMRWAPQARRSTLPQTHLVPLVCRCAIFLDWA